MLCMALSGVRIFFYSIDKFNWVQLLSSPEKQQIYQTGLQACPGAMRLNSVDKITVALCV